MVGPNGPSRKVKGWGPNRVSQHSGTKALQNVPTQLLGEKTPIALKTLGAIVCRNKIGTLWGSFVVGGKRGFRTMCMNEKRIVLRKPFARIQPSGENGVCALETVRLAFLGSNSVYRRTLKGQHNSKNQKGLASRVGGAKLNADM